MNYYKFLTNFIFLDKINRFNAKIKIAMINLFGLFYPKKCLTCAKVLLNYEEILCFSCRVDLPITNFTKIKENKTEKTFYGRVPVIAATSLLYFSKRGKVQKLIHQLKYKNQQQVGQFLGDWLGEEIIESKRFENIDCIIPVPLHPKRLKKRGYNQVITFGESLSKKLKIPLVENKLIRISKSYTQTFKNRFDRWKSVEEIFELSDSKIFENKHILLIDDVITTGATLEACCVQFMQAKNIKISIATMTITE
ncbi:MAG: ComF family protein [Flavobacteriaceae bacterium]|nr:ComF family protein [Flavobacteriaceae bacterium]